MTDISDIFKSDVLSIDTPFSIFTFWFLPNQESPFEIYDVYDISKGECIGIIYDSDLSITLDDDSGRYNEFTIKDDFRRYRVRPEYLVGKPVTVKENQVEDMATTYCQILLGVCLIRAYRKKPCDVDKAVDRVREIVDWLKKTNFFFSPASTRFHEAFEGGLVVHSLKVYNAIIDLKHVNKFVSVYIEDACLLAIIHDFCKIDIYQTYMKWVKNDENQWIQEPAFKKQTTELSAFGHGESSLFICMRLFKLKPEEGLAIRWHMGRWYTYPESENDLSFANRNYPLVFMLQFADQLAEAQY